MPTDSWTEIDDLAMRAALSEAEKGRGWVEPNPMVGAAVVRQGRLIAVAHHAVFGGPHAEVNALDKAGAEACGADLYVTLEPCCHHGKTPPCTQRIVRSGIKRVVAAMRDPFPLVAGAGLQELEKAGVRVELGLREQAARRLNAAYLKRLLTGRPHVLAKWAMSLDGKIATSTGESRWISNASSRARVHQLRGVMDAILIGRGTALADDPELTARPPGPRTATRVVLDPSASLSLSSKLVRSAPTIPTLLVVNQRADEQRLQELRGHGVAILAQPGTGPIEIPALLDNLGQRGWTNLLVEGGGQVLGSFFDAGCVDCVEVFIAPLLLGGAGARSPILGEGVAHLSNAHKLEDLRVENRDGDLHVRAQLAQAWRSRAGIAGSLADVSSPKTLGLKS